jgi:glycosyltransferase involved in cell wall biosynthesis
LHGTEINDFYASIDVFALPSVAESFGIAQVEAMMAGVPSVTTDLPGGRYPVTSTSFGQVVPARDDAALERAILELAASSPAWRAKMADRVRRRFDINACIDAHEQVYGSLREAASPHRAVRA